MLPNSIFKDQNFYYFLTFAIFAQLFKRLFAWCVLAYPRSVADASVKEEFARADFKLRRVDTIMSPNKETFGVLSFQGYLGSLPAVEACALSALAVAK